VRKIPWHQLRSYHLWLWGLWLGYSRLLSSWLLVFLQRSVEDRQRRRFEFADELLLLLNLYHALVQLFLDLRVHDGLRSLRVLLVVLDLLVTLRLQLLVLLDESLQDLVVLGDELLVRVVKILQVVF